LRSSLINSLKIVFVGIALAVLPAGRAAPAGDYLPWLRARTDISGETINTSTASNLIHARIYLARRAVINAPVRYETRGRSDLDMFYARHLIPTETPLFVLTRSGDSAVVACTIQHTYFSANPFAPGGKIDARSCPVDADADGVFEELRWSPSEFQHHSVHSFRVQPDDPPIAVSVPYRLSPEEYDSLVAPQFIDVTFSYVPSASGGAIQATVAGSDGSIVEHDHFSLARVRVGALRTFESFGISIELSRIDDAMVTWRPVHTLPADRDFHISYDYRD